MTAARTGLRALCIASLWPLCTWAQADFADDWHIYGSNTVRLSHYKDRGPAAASPYSITGATAHDEFNIYMSQQKSRWASWRAELSGVINDDEYRSGEKGIVPERVAYVREDGSGAVPYRLEAGDYFAYYSYLTLQRSLKGVQVEWQPASRVAGRHWSLAFTSGTGAANWRDLKPSDNYTNGASLLMQDQRLGVFTLNAVHNSRNASAAAGTLERDQYVLSLAGEKRFALDAQNLVLEGEVAHFDGDHNGVTDSASGQDRAGNGGFAQLSGNSTRLPFDYRLRFEHYDQDFRPQGAIVTADRQSLEAHGGWRFDSGMRLAARAQQFKDGVETGNKLRTRTVGFALSGPMLTHTFPGTSGRIDAYVQNRNNEQDTVSQLTQNVVINLSKPLPGEWVGRLGLFWQNLDDRTATSADLRTEQLSLSADHAITIAGFSGIITPGILVRRLGKSTNDSLDLSPTLALSLARGAHEFRLDYSTLSQNRRTPNTAPDVDTHNLNLDYNYRRGQHLFGVEANLLRRDAADSATTDAYRVSAYWTYSFDRPGRASVPTQTLAAVQSADTAIEASLAQLAPGRPAAGVQAALQRAGIRGATAQGGFQVYETTLLRNVPRRQRLALRYEAGVLESAALIIDFDNLGDRNSVAQTFELVRKSLIDEFGSPTRTVEQGEFDATFTADVNSGRLVRVTEWATPTGVIRFGIPRRLDRQVRMEVQHLRQSRQIQDTRWSIDSVR